MTLSYGPAPMPLRMRHAMNSGYVFTRALHIVVNTVNTVAMR